MLHSCWKCFQAEALIPGRWSHLSFPNLVLGYVPRKIRKSFWDILNTALKSPNRGAPETVVSEITKLLMPERPRREEWIFVPWQKRKNCQLQEGKGCSYLVNADPVAPAKSCIKTSSLLDSFVPTTALCKHTIQLACVWHLFWFLVLVVLVCVTSVRVGLDWRMQDFQRTNFGAPHTNKHLGDSTSPKNFCKRKSPVVFVVHQFCYLNRVSERSTTPLVHCCCLLLLQCVFPPNICSGPV